MNSKVRIGMRVHLVVQKDAGGPYYGRPKYFVNKKGERVDIPIGSKLYFPYGFQVKQYSDQGVGCWGGPGREFWNVNLVEKNGERGLLLPAGEEKYTTHYKEEPTVHRFKVSKRFVHISHMGECLARIVSTPRRS